MIIYVIADSDIRIDILNFEEAKNYVEQKGSKACMINNSDSMLDVNDIAFTSVQVLKKPEIRELTGYESDVPTPDELDQTLKRVKKSPLFIQPQLGEEALNLLIDKQWDHIDRVVYVGDKITNLSIEQISKGQYLRIHKSAEKLGQDFVIETMAKYGYEVTPQNAAQFQELPFMKLLNMYNLAQHIVEIKVENFVSYVDQMEKSLSANMDGTPDTDEYETEKYFGNYVYLSLETQKISGANLSELKQAINNMRKQVGGGPASFTQNQWNKLAANTLEGFQAEDQEVVTELSDEDVL